MTNATNWPATVRELANLAEQRGVRLGEIYGLLEDELGPCPLPPAGYRLAKGTEDVWTGEDIVNRNYIMMPAWNAATNQRSVELWTAKGSPDESFTSLTPAEALQLASDLVKLAKDAIAGTDSRQAEGK